MTNKKMMQKILDMMQRRDNRGRADNYISDLDCAYQDAYSELLRGTTVEEIAFIYSIGYDEVPSCSRVIMDMTAKIVAEAKEIFKNIINA